MGEENDRDRILMIWAHFRIINWSLANLGFPPLLFSWWWWCDISNKAQKASLVNLINEIKSKIKSACGIWGGGYRNWKPLISLFLCKIHQRSAVDYLLQRSEYLFLLQADTLREPISDSNFQFFSTGELISFKFKACPSGGDGQLPTLNIFHEALNLAEIKFKNIFSELFPVEACYALLVYYWIADMTFEANI